MTFLRTLAITCVFMLLIVVPMWADDGWMPIGDGLITYPDGTDPDVSLRDEIPIIAIAPDGTLYATWEHRTGWLDENNVAHTTSVIYIKRYNGTGWEEVGAGSASGDGLFMNDNPPIVIPNLEWILLSPAIAVGPDNIPYLAWVGGYNGTNTWYIYIQRFNGSTWENVGVGSGDSDGIIEKYSDKLSLVVRANDDIYLAWIGVEVWHFDGTEWESTEFIDPQDFSPTSGEGRDASLALDPDGQVYAAWGNDTGISVRRYSGGDWVDVGSYPGGYNEITHEENFATAPRYPALAINSAGTPYLTWQAGTNNRGERIYVKRFVDSAWEEVGDYSASQWRGINGFFDPLCPDCNDGSSGWRPQIGFGFPDVPYIAWIERGQLNPNGAVFVKRFNGEYWEETNLGSASQDGVSTGSGEIYAFSIATFGQFDSPVYMVWSSAVGQVASLHAPTGVVERSLFTRGFNPQTRAQPINRNYYTTTSPTLTWNPVVGAVGYKLQVAQNRSFTTIADVYETTDLSQTLMPLPDGIYYWRIRVKIDATRWGSWGRIDSFVIDG